MKRLLSFLALTAAISCLVACSSQESMNGECYEIGDFGTDLVITIDGDTGTVDAKGSTTNMTIDTDLKIFTFEGFSDLTVEYEYGDGVISVNITGLERQCYRKGSEAYEKN